MDCSHRNWPINCSNAWAVRFIETPQKNIPIKRIKSCGLVEHTCSCDEGRVEIVKQTDLCVVNVAILAIGGLHIFHCVISVQMVEYSWVNNVFETVGDKRQRRQRTISIFSATSLSLPGKYLRQLICRKYGVNLDSVGRRTLITDQPGPRSGYNSLPRQRSQRVEKLMNAHKCYRIFIFLSAE